jgi:Ca2+-binding RTX toxin-like protein
MAIINARRPVGNQFIMTNGTSFDDVVNGSDGNDYIMAGAGNDTVFGGLGNDYINGGVGADILYGGSGNDVLDAGARNWNTNPLGDLATDVLMGGTGNDRYTVYEALDQVVENAGEGTDSVTAWRTSYTLSANVENLQIISMVTDSTVGRGNELNNTLVGFWGKDSLFGEDGDDVIGNGASFDGDDFLVGGRGSDTYRFGFFGGHDVIDNAAADNATTTDKFVWMGSSELGRLCFKQSGNDLLINVNQSDMYGSMSTQWGRISGGPTSITVKNWYSNPSARLDCFVNELAGKTLYEADVQKLVDAMAAYDAKNASGTATAADRTTLNNIIAACWK